MYRSGHAGKRGEHGDSTSYFAGRDSVARTAEGLGWFGLGLGVPRLLAPA